MKHVYCISGFGADERVFAKLTFPGYETHFINWLIPEKNESIVAYAKRLTGQIHHEKPILTGLSFGGIMCIEISKLILVEKIILISSIKTFDEMPLQMRFAGKLKLHKIFPMRSFKLIEPIENYNLGIETSEEKNLVHQYRKNINQQYTDWAINTILNWDNTFIPQNLFHIHGDKDRIFPVKNLKPDYVVKTGGHFMIMNRYEMVNKHINSILLNQVTAQTTVIADV
jgi:pimeloyl-ACP methyl ester carboxylesterase